MRGARAALALVTALALLAPVTPRTASAGGTVWSRVRQPEAERRRELAAEAQVHEIKAQHLLHSRSQLDRTEVVSHLVRAAILLEEAGAATSSDLFLRYRLGAVYLLQDEPRKALALLESIGRADPPAALRATVFADLAVTYAHLGRVEDEIAAYGESLRVQPVSHERARLLANRAEAYMLLGDITAAVRGYRAALALLSADHMMFGTGSTTLWGLAVALDRSGDLDSGLDAIRVARSYDAQDKLINGPSWFYMPDYDRYWYEALGHWQVARKARGGGLGARRRLRPRRRVVGRVRHRGRGGPRRQVAPPRPRPRQAVREGARRLPPPACAPAPPARPAPRVF